MSTTGPAAKGGGVPVGLVAAVIVVVVALGAVMVYLLGRGEEELAGTGPQGSLPEGGGMVIAEGSGEDVPRLHLYADFQCPWCAALEEQAGDDLAAAAAGGEVALTVSLRTFLDDTLSNDASTRAAELAMCVADEGQFLEFYQRVLAHQPATEGEGWTDAELLGHAQAAGVEGEALERTRGCYEQGRYADYVTDMDERAVREGVTGTPTLAVDGEPLSQEEMTMLLSEEDGLRTVLEAGA
ncbi:DsbA family protein [Ornithinicoccus halotolerans]|uniref:DsbA family protein n=1 Tax=Ornithinicoccus halotolerans TaxID=1748220 RepID=UPI0012972C4B|nr:thioredoxin domain-containing protein [Ornithinicoccus halotolerans]